MPIETQESCNQFGCGPDCPLPFYFPKANFVPPRLGSSLRLVVADAPGDAENAAKIPLIGAGGKWMQSLMRQAGVRWDDLTLAYLLPMQPVKNIYPTDALARSYINEAEAVKLVDHVIEHHLKPLLASRPWERIDILGDKALEALTGLKGIFTWRGSPLALKGETVPRAVPTLDPMVIIRDQTLIPVVINDLKKSLVVPPERYDLAPTIDKVREFTATEFAFDIETNPATQQIKMVGIAAKPFETLVLPWTGPYIQELRRIFAAATRVIGQNLIQFDLPILAANMVRISPDCHVADIMLMQHLLCPDLPHDLEFIASQFTNKPAWKSLDRDKDYYWQLRCARDVDATLQAYRVLAPMLRMEKLDHLYDYVQVPLARICRLMHETGFKRDPKRLVQVREKLLQEIRDGEAQLPPELRTHTVAVKKRQKAPAGTLGKSGKPVKFIHVDTEEESTPWRSNEVLEKYLYGTLNLPVQLHVKTKKPTTDKTALEKLERRCRRDGNVAAAALLGILRNLRKASTLVSSFCQEKSEGVSRVHAHFNVHGTSSGRLSSSDPNLQNQPETARYIYVPSHADWQILQFDYSSGENRLTAWYANDKERMARLAQPGFNEHKWNAAQMFGIPYDEVVKDNSKDAPYGKAKRIGHGLNYGMGIQKICNTFDLDYAETKENVLAWKRINAKTTEWQERVTRQAEQDGYLKTPFDRKRWFYTSSLYTESLSFLPQSTLADVIFRAMIALMYERIGWPYEKVLQIARVVEPLPQPAQLLVQVHDSLVIEAPRALVGNVVEIVTRVMQQPWPELGGLSIPVECEVAPPGASWGECKPYKLVTLAA